VWKTNGVLATATGASLFVQFVGDLLHSFGVYFSSSPLVSSVFFIFSTRFEFSFQFKIHKVSINML
jgi:hypothetical protein